MRLVRLLLASFDSYLSPFSLLFEIESYFLLLLNRLAIEHGRFVLPLFHRVKSSIAENRRPAHEARIVDFAILANGYFNGY